MRVVRRLDFSTLEGVPARRRVMMWEAVVGVGEDEIAAGELPRHPVEPPASPALTIMGLDFGNREVIGANDSIAKNSELLEVRDRYVWVARDRAVPVATILFR